MTQSTEAADEDEVRKSSHGAVAIRMDIRGFHLPKILFERPSHVSGAARRLQTTQFAKWTSVGNHVLD